MKIGYRSVSIFWLIPIVLVLSMVLNMARRLMSQILSLAGLLSCGDWFCGIQIRDRFVVLGIWYTEKTGFASMPRRHLSQTRCLQHIRSDRLGVSC